jgi:hypothetical protein
MAAEINISGGEMNVYNRFWQKKKQKEYTYGSWLQR